MTDKPKPMTLRERAAQMQHTWDSDEGDQWVKDALDQLDEMAAAAKIALSVGEIHFKTCALSDHAYEKLTAALVRYEGRDE